MSTIITDSKVNQFVARLSKTTLNLDTNVITAAEHALATLDFPTTRQEDWKYTRVTKISNKSFNATKGNITVLPVLPINDAYTIVFVNGYFTQELSSKDIPSGVSIKIGNEIDVKAFGTIAAIDRSVFSAINTLYATDAVSIEIEKNTVVEKSIQIVHIQTGELTISNTRVFIEAKPFSKAHIVETYLSIDAVDSFTNVTTEVIVEENAYLHIDKIQNEEEATFSIHQDHVKQAKDSNFTINTITLNGGLVRNNLNIDVLGKNCETHLNGTYVLNGTQHVDNHTCVDHLEANCESNELYKGVMDGKSTAVFNGKVFVRKNSQKINAYQSNGNVLLSDEATVNSKPELEIYADDVKCSHGSTTGQLDDEAVFYLRARGISEKSAKALMVTAFIGDVIEKVENQEIVAYIHTNLHARFGWNF